VWIVASLKPKLFCGVALIGEKFPSAGKRWTHTKLRHNNCQRPNCTPVEQRLHPLQNQLDVAYLFQTFSPKRETIRVSAKCVKREGGFWPQIAQIKTQI